MTRIAVSNFWRSSKKWLVDSLDATGGLGFMSFTGPRVRPPRYRHWPDLIPKVDGLNSRFAARPASSPNDVTTLNPGEMPHPGHRHPEEELMIVKEGTLEAVQNDKTSRVGPGGMVFEASNEFHSVKNIGKKQAVYYVIKFVPPGLSTKRLE